MTRLSILQNVFNFLGKNFNYAIIHHANDMMNKDKDIDIVIATTKDILYNKFIDFAKEEKLYIANIYTIDINVYRIDLVKLLDGEYFLIQLDFFTDNSDKNLMPIKSNELLKHKKQSKFEDIDIYVLEEETELDYYVMKKAYKEEDIVKHISYFESIGFNDIEKIKQNYNKKVKYFNSIQYKLKYIINRLVMLYIRAIEKNKFKTIILIDNIEEQKCFISYLKESLIFRYVYTDYNILSLIEKARKVFQPFLSIEFELKNNSNNSNYDNLKLILEQRNAYYE